MSTRREFITLLRRRGGVAACSAGEVETIMVEGGDPS